ncbi:hypothetical protein [Flavobacterium sp.]|uniref:hypothetical protein n=1 Tax=Flavobacterium sp. TaxID=239 RepID=UPI00286D2D0D|nr:hypothetical protein [Flavobacterium sp.]
MSKKLYTLILLVFTTTILLAQVPQKMSYQAVIRNASNTLVANTNVGMRISILRTSVSGTTVYIETHSTTTNANGLATLQIGNGPPQFGNFASIDWSDGPYFVKTETDPTGGSNYTISATTQLLSVPYALLAEKAVKPTYPVSVSAESTTFLPLVTRNTWVDDPNPLVTVPETGKYLITFYSHSGNNSAYIVGVDTDYDGSGQVRVFNTTTSSELYKTASIWMRFDQYTNTSIYRIYDPLNPSTTFIKNLVAGDVLKLQYRQDAFGNFAAITNQWSIGAGGISLLKIGD